MISANPFIIVDDMKLCNNIHHNESFGLINNKTRNDIGVFGNVKNVSSFYIYPICFLSHVHTDHVCLLFILFYILYISNCKE